MGFNLKGHYFLVTSDKNLGLEIWLWILKVSLSKEDFLSKGVTKACLNLSGKTPSASDMLMMLVIGIRRTSRHSLMMKVGQGSSSQDLVGDLDMSFPTSSLVGQDTIL